MPNTFASNASIMNQVRPVQMRGLDWGTGGHFRVSHSFALVATQAAASRLFEFRNASATNINQITGVTVTWTADAAHTAPIFDALDMFPVSGFSAVDSANQVPLTPIAVSSYGMNSTSTAVIQGVTVAGAAAGMTGGTITTINANALCTCGQVLPQAISATGPNNGPVVAFYGIDTVTEYPLTLSQNEGFIISNRVLLGAAAGSKVTIAVSYMEAPKANVF